MKQAFHPRWNMGCSLTHTRFRFRQHQMQYAFVYNIAGTTVALKNFRARIEKLTI